MIIKNQLRFHDEKHVNIVESDEFRWIVEVKQRGGVLRLFVTHVEEVISIEGVQSKLSLHPEKSWDIPVTSVEIYCHSSHEEALMVCFKAAEFVIKKRFGIDDLVQLNGYYQQSNQQLLVNFEHISVDMSDNWTVAALVAKSELVGQIVPIEEWCKLFSKEPLEIFELFKDLKLQGFDIRDNHTNPRIEPNHVLVTYAFPTLTTAKVQWEKSLGGMVRSIVDLAISTE